MSMVAVSDFFFLKEKAWDAAETKICEGGRIPHKFKRQHLPLVAASDPGPIHFLKCQPPAALNAFLDNTMAAEQPSSSIAYWEVVHTCVQGSSIRRLSTSNF